MTELHWTEKYIRDGFVILKNLVDREYCEQALKRVRELVNNDLPLNEWTTANAPVLYRPFLKGYTAPEPVLDRLFEQPRLVSAIEEMFGGPGRWNEARNSYLFLKPYDPDARAELAPKAHVDFPGQIIPILYRGFVMQLSLVDSEPFSGNITFFPGTHRTVQKTLMENPDMELRELMETLPLPEPVEFVAQAGDVAFYHHLLMHEGNPSHAAGRTPRVVLTGEVFCDKWLNKVDPAQPNLSPWERSLTLNGYYEETRHEVEQAAMQKRKDYFEKLQRESVEARASSPA
jgi:hypothetical protein